MKRLLVAAALALLAHSFFLAMPPGWLRKRFADIRGSEAVTLTLAYYRPQKEQIEAKGAAPSKRAPKKIPTIKEKPKKKALKKPPAKKIPRKLKKKVTQSKDMPDRKEAPRKTAAPEQQKTETNEPPSPSDFGLSKSEDEERSSPAASRMALKEPAGKSLRQAIPIYRENPPPPYPRAARIRGYEGTTILEVLVNREGRVDEVRLSSSSGHSLLDRAAKTAVKKWIFIPAVRDNKKVEMWVKIPIRFQLR